MSRIYTKSIHTSRKGETKLPSKSYRGIHTGVDMVLELSDRLKRIGVVHDNPTLIIRITNETAEDIYLKPNEYIGTIDIENLMNNAKSVKSCEEFYIPGYEESFLTLTSFPNALDVNCDLKYIGLKFLPVIRLELNTLYGSDEFDSHEITIEKGEHLGDIRLANSDIFDKMLTSITIGNNKLRMYKEGYSV